MAQMSEQAPINQINQSIFVY